MFLTRSTLRFGATLITSLAVCSVAMADDAASTEGGITVRSDDGRFVGSLGGLVQFDGSVFDNDQFDNASGIDFRRARLRSYGAIDIARYMIEVDFQDNGTELTNAWLDFDLGPGTLRVGQWRQPFGISSGTTAANTQFMERSFLDRISPRFQLGLGYRGRLGLAGYQASVYSPDDADSGQQEGVGTAARIFVGPELGDFTQLHFGLGVLHEAGLDGDAAAETVTVRPIGNASSPVTLLSAAAGTVNSTRYTFDAAAAVGPTSLQFEWATASFEDDAIDEDVVAYAMTASFILTGETRNYLTKSGAFGSVIPASPRGALELAVRFDYIENDELDAEVENLGVALNWYASKHLRVALNYLDTDTLDGADESNALYARLQLTY